MYSDIRKIIEDEWKEHWWKWVTTFLVMALCMVFVEPLVVIKVFGGWFIICLVILVFDILVYDKYFRKK